MMLATDRNYWNEHCYFREVNDDWEMPRKVNAWKVVVIAAAVVDD